MQITFFSDSLDDLFDEKRRQLIDYVARLPESHFEHIDQEQFSNLTVAKFALPEMPAFATGEIQRDEPRFRQGTDAVVMTVYIPFQGESSHFRYYHHSRPVPCPVFECKDGMLLKSYTLGKHELHLLDERVQQDVERIQQFVQLAREMVPRFNTMLHGLAGERFKHRVYEIGENRKALATIAKSRFTVRKRNDGAEQVLVPVKRKPIALSKALEPDALQDYVLGMIEYNDILSTITSMAMVMERTPSVFATMNEEPLRTILLVALNGIYEGQATGETFNGHGKTDILIRRGDRNVFIAECLMWKGAAYLRNKLNDQLLQYAMWRDSKVALIVFSRGGEFTHVVERMKETVRTHQQFVRDLEWKHESGARYVFRRHDDPQRFFVLSAMAFDVPDDG